MPELLPVFELEASGFTHLSCRCKACGHATALTFAQMRAQVPASAWAMTLEELAAYLGCGRCGAATEIAVEKRARVIRHVWGVRRRA